MKKYNYKPKLKIFMKTLRGDLHIGKLIQKRLQEKGKSACWLADKIHTVRTNVYDIFHRENIDVQLLSCISEVLSHDFFKEISEFGDYDNSFGGGVTYCISESCTTSTPA